MAVKLRNSIIFLSIVLATFLTFDLPTIRSESKIVKMGKFYLDDQYTLRRLFRNSNEMDETGFHEGDVESHDVLDQDIHQLKNTLQPENGVNQDYQSASGPDAIFNVDVAEIQNDTGLAENFIGKEILKDVEYQLESETSSGVENGVHDDYDEGRQTTYTPPINPPAQRKKIEVIDFIPEAGKTDAPSSVQSLGLLAPPLKMSPPPFLITRTFHGYRYIYQLRYPMFAQPSDVDFSGNGLTHKTVYGPPPLIELEQGVKSTSCPLSLSATLPPRTKPESESKQNSPIIFMFFKWLNPSNRRTK